MKKNGRRNFARIARYRLRAVFGRKQLDRDMDEEMRFHLEMTERENLDAGMTYDEARRQARITFGGLENMKEITRDARGISWYENLARDIRISIRQLRKSPGFTAVAIVTLMLGIGACAAMFSVVNAVVIEPLPVKEPERLVWVANFGSGGMSARTTRVDNFLEWKERNNVFEKIGAYFAFFDYQSYILNDGDGEPERLKGVPITKDFLDTLGVKPMLGRGFVAEELKWNGRPAAILSHSFWKSRFSGNSQVVGTTINLNGQSTEIVGIMPSNFDFDSIFTPGTNVEILTPFPTTDETARWGNTLSIIGRLKPGATMDQARTELSQINESIKTQFPDRGNFRATVSDFDEQIRGRFHTAFFVLSGAVICVLLIACVNLSNLLLAKANSRRKEFAMRIALGAGRWSLMRQVLVESSILAACGCLCSLPLAIFLTKKISGLQAFSIPQLQNASINGLVLGIIVLLTFLAGLLCGLIPALQLSDLKARKTLDESGERGSAGKQSVWIRKTLVVSEVALACMLLIGAGLLIRSFVGLLQVDLGFQPDNGIAWRIDPTRDFPSLAERNAYYDGLVNRLEAIPGVTAVGISDTLPLGRNRSWGARRLEESGDQRKRITAYPRLVDYRYIKAMKINLLSGRLFGPTDTQDTARVVVINETMKRRLWQDKEALGQVARINGNDYQVIGVVGDVRHSALDEKAGAEMYLNIRQNGGWSATDIVIRSSRANETLIRGIRSAIKGYDSSLATTDYRFLQEIVDHSVAPQKLIKDILTGFSSLALLLAAVGLYGVISYSVSQRANEMGIRMAIGAKREEVTGLIVGEGFRLALVGVVLGLLAAFGLSRYLKSLLYEIDATDLATFALTAAIVMSISVLASYSPARRAARTHPAVALRAE